MSESAGRSSPPEVDEELTHPSDRMYERADESSAKLWALTEANRWYVAATMLGLVFVSMVALGASDPSPLERSMAVSDPVETLFQAFVTAIITGVTLVVSLNQLVLSPELEPIADKRDEMEGAMHFRDDVSEIIDADISSPEPAIFLRDLVATAREEAKELDALVAETDDETLQWMTERYVTDLTRNADEVTARLSHADFGTFDVLSAVLDFNYSWKIYLARHIRNRYAGSADDEVRDAFEDLAEVLSLFGPAREHFKTLYFQWELVNLSRAMLYAAVPALVISAAMILYYDPRTFQGATLGISTDILVTSLAMTISITPFAVLLSYILRIGTVAKRTLAVGPFVLRSMDRDVERE